jgi:hypothetical protein
MSDKNNTIDNEIEDRIKALKDLNNSLDDYENLFSKLTNNKSLDYDKINENISPEERANLNWTMCYSIYSNYFCNRII